jgi:hypothetical protein
MAKTLKDAREDDYIEDLKCPNPRCGQVGMIKLVGRDPTGAYVDRPKILECQHCFGRYHVDNELHGLEWPGEPEKRKKKVEDE